VSFANAQILEWFLCYYPIDQMRILVQVIVNDETLYFAAMEKQGLNVRDSVYFRGRII